MPMSKRAAHPAAPERRRISHQEREERKERVLEEGTLALTGSIADAVVIKDENLYFLSAPDGSVPLERGHGFGLYYHDCRFLNGYELHLGGTKPQALVSTAARGFKALLQMTNVDIRRRRARLIPKEAIGIRWERVIRGTRRTLHDRITFENFGLEPVQFDVSLSFQAEFEDVFTVRGYLPVNVGKLRPPAWNGATLHMRAVGADKLVRSVAVGFWPPPRRTPGTTAHFRLTLEPRACEEIRVSIQLAESDGESRSESRAPRAPEGTRAAAPLQRSSDERLERHTRFQSNSLLFNQLVERSLRDLGMLRTRLGGEEFLAAGVPWFVALFGRDSLVTALQTLAFDPTIAEQTVRLLAKYQGRQVDTWREEQPGKILHELRVGELARAGEIPHTPYYGTVDATPLFLILLAHHAAWTGELALFAELRPNVESALRWIAEYGDRDGDGYVEYESSSEDGLANQGWKDSGDAIVRADGALAEPPLALVEVQGYVYLAKRSVAELFRRAGEPERARKLEREAEALRARFNRDFWLENHGLYALALERAKRPVAVVSSNAGHALWAGIAEPGKARRTMERLMAEDMFSGWGVRTLSTRERRYNPIGYHLGTVWPHDNALIAAGFRRYGFDDAARRILGGLVQAAMHFRHFRLPELFAGFARADFRVPARYPVANHPQAWGAGSVLHLVEAMLGLVPEAFEHRLRLVRPTLPEFVDRLELTGLTVGPARADLRVRRREGEIDVDVLNADGQLDVIVQRDLHPEYDLSP